MTRAKLGVTAGAVACVLLACGVQKPLPDLEELYRSRQWLELRALVDDSSSALIRGAVAGAFNDPARAERLLRGVIHSDPRPAVVDDAYGLLSQIYIRSGQYRRFAENYDDWAGAFPDSAAVRQERENLDKFRGRPDQLNPRIQGVTLRHPDDAFSLPVTINGRTDDFLFDTGAWQSVLTEAKAKLLELTLSEGTSALTDASGTKTPFKTAVVPEVEIGGMRFREVSFAVLTGGPYKDVEAGVVGMPILLALRQLRWAKDGDVAVGSASEPSGDVAPNLVFDRHRLVVRSSTHGKNVLLSLDTGARTSDLNANFADLFPSVVAGGKRGTQELTGAGGTRTFDSIEIPDVGFELGSSNVALRPALVTLQRLSTIGGECCVGNAGHDLLTQADSFALDFGAMTLELR